MWVVGEDEDEDEDEKVTFVLPVLPNVISRMCFSEMLIASEWAPIGRLGLRTQSKHSQPTRPRSIGREWVAETRRSQPKHQRNHCRVLR